MAKMTPSSGNVFKDFGRTDAQAENLRVRAELMLAIECYIKAQGWTQTEAAKHFGVPQPRISNLMRGKINDFTIDTLVNLLASVDQRVTLAADANNNNDHDPAIDEIADKLGDVLDLLPRLKQRYRSRPIPKKPAKRP
jgi:predicted XRE-type DNA-binding protein